MKCPSCGFNNIEGADSCESCQSDLTHPSHPVSKAPSFLQERTIREVPPQKALCVLPKTSLKEVIEKMGKLKASCAIVAQGNCIKGIFTERDLLFRVVGQKKLTDPVENAMTVPAITLNEGDSIAYALNKMSLGGYRHIPILKDERISGVISVRDILEFISKSLVN
ncbi:MAG: CBS domain-containing protein, partial [bacterium]|nr:CBS domain-containing protein [bacterium]